MTINKNIPSSNARVETQKAGQRLVDQKLVTQQQLDALLKSPVLSSTERQQARQIVEGILEAGVGALGARAADAFAAAVHHEAHAETRITQARAALGAGAVDDGLFRRLSVGGDVGIRGRVELFARWRSAEREVHRLTALLPSVTAEMQDALETRLDRAKDRLALLESVSLAMGTGDVEHTRELLQNAAATGIGVTVGFVTMHLFGVADRAAGFEQAGITRLYQSLLSIQLGMTGARGVFAKITRSPTIV